MLRGLCRLGGRGRRRPLPAPSHPAAPTTPLLLRPQQPPRAAAAAWAYDPIACSRLNSSSTKAAASAAAPSPSKPKPPSPARQRQLLVEALLPAFKDADYGRVLALLNHPQPQPPIKPDATTAVAALTQTPALAPLSLALYKVAAVALAREGLDGEALALLQGGFRQGHLSEAGLKLGYDGVLWGLRIVLRDDGTRLLCVVDAVSKGRVRPTDGGYVPLLEALGERAAVDEIDRVLTERVGPDAALPAARKAVVFGLGIKYLVEADFEAGRLLALKEGMQQRWGVPVNDAHLGLLASALAGQGRVAACLALLREQWLKVTDWNRVVTAALVGLLRYQQQQGQQQEHEEGEGPVWEGAIRLLSLVTELGQRPTSHSVSSALLVCGRAGHWPLALRLFDEGLWWDRVRNAEGAAEAACDRATLNAAMEVLPPLDFDGGFSGGSWEEEKENGVLLRLFGPGIYQEGVAAGLSRGWEQLQLQQQRQRQRSKRQLGNFVIDLHEHSVRMALYGALPHALHDLQRRWPTAPFPFRVVHIVTGHGTGRGRYRGLGPEHKPQGDVGVLFPRVRRWAERGVGVEGQGKVLEVSLGCVGVEAEALRRALPALLASVS